MCGEEFGDVAGCWPERPARDTCVVFGDNKVWATCWDGGWGGVAKNSAMSPIVGQGDRQKAPASFWVATRCGLRVGMEVEVVWRRIR